MPHSEHEKGYPSVTEVLGVVHKEFIVRWYGKYGTEYCERVKRESGEFGSTIHTLIEQRLRGQDIGECSPRQREMVNTFDKWQRQSGFVPVEIERKVEHKGLKYHGTFDVLGHFTDGTQLFLLDWKTSRQIDNLYGAQLAAYAEAYKDETGVAVAAGGIVRLEKDPSKPKQIEVKTFNELPNYFEVFKACLVIHQFLHPGKKRK